MVSGPTLIHIAAGIHANPFPVVSKERSGPTMPPMQIKVSLWGRGCSSKNLKDSSQERACLPCVDACAELIFFHANIACLHRSACAISTNPTFPDYGSYEPTVVPTSLQRSPIMESGLSKEENSRSRTTRLRAWWGGSSPRKATLDSSDDQVSSQSVHAALRKASDKYEPKGSEKTPWAIQFYR